MSTQSSSSPSDTALRVLVLESMKANRRTARSLASALGVEYGSFLARLHGRVRFQPDEITGLIRELREQRLCDFLLKDTDFVAVPRPSAVTAHDGSAWRAAIRLASVCVASIARLGDALADGGLTAECRDALLADLHEAERAIAAVRISLPHFEAPHRAAFDHNAVTDAAEPAPEFPDEAGEA